MSTARSDRWLMDASDLKVSSPSSSPLDWRWRWRRAIVNPLVDAWGLGVATLTLAAICGALGVAATAGGLDWLGRVAIGLAGLMLWAHVVLAFKAFKRDKAIQFWAQTQVLTRRLARESAHREMLAATLRRVHDLDHDGGDLATDGVLAALVEEFHGVLETSHDDVAVVLALQGRTHYRILNSAASPGSRWRRLQPGKECPVKGSVEETLRKLAPYHEPFGIETSYGKLQFVVLSLRPLEIDGDTTESEALFDQIRLCLRLIADRRPPSGRPVERTLQPV